MLPPNRWSPVPSATSVGRVPGFDRSNPVSNGLVSVGVLDHVNIRTANLEETVRFYCEVLGLSQGPRPNFSFPGAWIYSEGRAVVHLVDIGPTGEAQKPDSGVVHHIAFASRGFARM